MNIACVNLVNLNINSTGYPAKICTFSAGSGTIAVLTSFRQVQIEVWGGGGAGVNGCGPPASGGSGAYARYILSNLSNYAGQSLAYNVGIAGSGVVSTPGTCVGNSGGQSSVNTGTFVGPWTPLSSPGGVGGTSSIGGSTPGAGGAAGTGPPCSVQQAGNPGVGPSGGASVSGLSVPSGGAGGPAATPFGPGGSGIIRFTWS